MHEAVQEVGTENRVGTRSSERWGHNDGYGEESGNGAGRRCRYRKDT